MYMYDAWWSGEKQLRDVEACLFKSVILGLVVVLAVVREAM